MNKFVHLHVHTEYSLLDGAAKIKDLIKEVKKQGNDAVAITDHGCMFGVIKFYKECKKENIKPIIGSEVYVTDDLYKRSYNRAIGENNTMYHLVLLAKNTEGFENLIKISSKGFVDGFYHRPRIDLDYLSKHSKGLICLSACIAGAIPQLLLNRTSSDPYADAKEYALKLKDMFDEGDFYIELQDHHLEEQREINPQLAKLANEIGVKCVATNDVHYIHQSDHKMHDVLLCIQTASDFDDPNRFHFPCNEFYLKDYEEMKSVLGWCPESLENTLEIAEKCNLEIAFHDYTIPYYDPPDKSSDKDYLRKLCFEGLEKRYGTITKEIEERANMELGVIISMGFASYYLIVWDFIKYAKSKDIPVGAGRGSGVGSIVAYAIGITDVDPLKYGLIFERFLNSSRNTMPDFDIDFCGDRRDEVIEYVREKYGKDKVAQIITFGTMKTKQAIKDVARVFKLPFAEVNKLVKNITADSKAKISDLIDPSNPNQVPELVEMFENNETYKEVLELAAQIEDMPRNRGKHAAGVIICRVPLVQKVPLSRSDNDILTQFDMNECEELGLLKMDFLALKTLTDIKMTQDYIKRYKNIDIDFDKLGYEDQNVYGMISTGETDTVFQLESSGFKSFMKRLKPTFLEEIIAGVALYRPGPLDYIPKYVYNKQHQDKIDYRHPLLKPILESTYGIIVYQEQAMRITQMLAGYSMNEADNFRKFISKKKIEELPEQKAKFINGCIKNGIDEKFAEEIWKELETFGHYAFNKSHAAAYSVLTYQTAYLKRYYPVEYFCSVINNRLGFSKDINKYLRLLQALNIELLPPDINHSEALFTPQNDKIRYGLASIKKVGMQAIETVIQERKENGEFTSFTDFARRGIGQFLNKGMLENLIKAGVFDGFKHNRKTLLNCYEEVIAQEQDTRNLLAGGQMFFDFMVEEEYEYKEIEETQRERLAMEKEATGKYLTGHPLADKQEEFKEFDFNLSMLTPSVELDEEEEEIIRYSVTNGDEVYLGGLISDVTIKTSSRTGRRWGYAILEDMYDSVEILFFNRALEVYKNYLVDDALVKIRGKIMLEDGIEPKIEVKSVMPWSLEEIEDNRILCLKIDIDDKSSFGKVQEILKNNTGSNKVKIQSQNKVYELKYTVGNLDQIKDQIVSIIGYRNLKIIE